MARNNKLVEIVSPVLIGAIAGLVIGGKINGYSLEKTTPRKAILVDVNGDKIEEIIVKSQRTYHLIESIKSQDGEYYFTLKGDKLLKKGDEAIIYNQNGFGEIISKDKINLTRDKD